jgi:AcrR family transcriptional regulator
MLNAATFVIAREGFERMSVARVTGGARVSRRTFYDVFEDREDCFLAVFEDALARAEGIAQEAYERERGSWHERVRAALGALLAFIDQQPEMRAVLITDALMAGPRVLARRVEVLGRAGGMLHGEAVGSAKGRGSDLPSLIGEAVVNAVFGLVHARCAERPSRSLLPLLGELMGVIVLPYEGPGATRRELSRPAPRGVSGVSGSRVRRSVPMARDALADLPIRLTYRTVRVLSTIAERPGSSNRTVSELAERPGSSNRTVSELAELSDQGQTSKLLQRLEKLGLIRNNGLGHAHGETNAWRLTPRGVEVERAVRISASDRDNDPRASERRRSR